MNTTFRLIVVAASGGGREAFERIVGRFAPDFHGATAAVIDSGGRDSPAAWRQPEAAHRFT